MDNLDKLDNLIFYTMEKAIKSYRRHGQNKLRENHLKITIDQWLIIKSIMESPFISQQEIAEKVFKDNASVTRIIDLLFKAKYIKRTVNKTDRRKTILIVTEEGTNLVNDVYKVVMDYRATVLKGISKQDIDTTNKVLSAIIDNCK